MATPNRIRNKKCRQKKIESGLQQINLFVPKARVPDIRAIAEQMREEFFNSTVTATHGDRATHPADTGGQHDEPFK